MTRIGFIIMININKKAESHVVPIPISLPIKDPISSPLAIAFAINGTTILSTTGEKVIAKKIINPYAKKKASVFSDTPNHAAIKKGIKNPIPFPKVLKIVVVIISRDSGREFIAFHIFKYFIN
jgi:hypothetical protein